MTTQHPTQYAPRDENSPWRVDTWMNTAAWKEVSRWYPFSLRSLIHDRCWSERAWCKMRDDAYQIMKALAGTGRSTCVHDRAVYACRQ